MTRQKFKTDRTVISRIFHPKVLEEARKALKAIDSKRPYPPSKKKSRNIGKG